MSVFTNLKEWLFRDRQSPTPEEIEANQYLENDLKKGYLTQEQYDDFQESFMDDQEEMPPVEDWFDL